MMTSKQIKNFSTVTRQPHIMQLIRQISGLSRRSMALTMWGVLATFALLVQIQHVTRSYFGQASIEVSVFGVPLTTNVSELSSEDRGLYTMIFAAQSKGDYAKADELIRGLNNTFLVGYVLAERFLSDNYKAKPEELKYWLTYFSDQPQAASIASLASARGMDVTLPAPVKPLRGEGYSDHLGRSAMPDSWYTALNEWKGGKYAEAKPIFTKLSENEDLSDWQRSAAYFWAYRTADKLGEKHAAHSNLKHAAEYKTTFYGLIANAQLGNRNLRAEAPEVSSSVRNDPRAIRAALLVSINRTEDAEAELRALYSATSEFQRSGIVTLASELGLSNLQIRLAKTKGLSDSEALFAAYPTPQYMVNLHPLMDSALLMAVARNESGFREVAHSSAGAMGMMQMMPATARAVERRVGESLLREASLSGDTTAERLNDPAMSARYGAEYLNMLAAEPAINNNLIHLLVGYNAGPGTVANWKNAGRTISDPLLYIESIPYAETRNYVMQVSAQYWIYQEMMNETPTSLQTLTKGEWPELPRAGV